MDFYFTDRQYNLLGIASTERGKFRMAGEIEAQSTTASTVALTGNVYFAKDDLNDAINMVVGEGGNYIMYQDDRGIGHFMTIQDTQVDNTGCSINFQADDAGNDLKNEIVGTYTATKAMTFEQYFNLFCADSGWELGQNEIPSNVRTLEFTSEQTSYDRMLEVATGFGVSLYYTFEINGLEPVHRYLNVVNKLGSTTNVTLRQGTDISQIVSETSTADLHTSIKAYGATPDGKTAPLNLAGYKWTDSTGQFALGSDGVLRDTIAIRTWSRLRSNTNPTPESSHLQMVKTYDATTQATLLQSALADLKQYNHPAVNYTVTMARVPSELTKGDVVNVEDEWQNLYLSATVLEVDKCYSVPSSSTLTLGDFVIQHDQTSASIKQAAAAAEAAASKAQAASTVAYSAQATASTASSAASDAYSAASQASSIASQASSAASSAATTANTAQTTASNAATTASTAQDTATAAAQAADTAQTLAKANRTFIKSATAPDTTNLPTNAVWITPATSTTSASAKTWDGTNWQETPIESSLIADDIVGKTITGSTFGNTTGTFKVDENGNMTGAAVNGSTFSTSNTYSDKLSNLDSINNSVANPTVSVTAKQTLDKPGYKNVATFTNPVLGLPETTTTTIDNGGNIKIIQQTSSTDYIHFALGPAYLGLEFEAQGKFSSASNSGLQIGQLTTDMLVGMINAGQRLWSGLIYPTATQSCTPTMSLSQCLYGWILVWSRTDGATVNDSRFFFSFIPKRFAVEFSGKGITFSIDAPASATDDSIGPTTKYIYVTDTTITGYAANNVGNSKGYALREVLAW